MATDIELVTNTLTEFDKVAAGLAILRKNYEGMLFDVETPEGMRLAKAARQVIRQPRYDIERLRKDAKAPLLAIGRKLDDEAKRITGELLKLEDPIDQQIKHEESRKEREKAEAEAREVARVAGIQARIDAIRTLPVSAAGKSSAQVAAIQAEAAAIVVDGSFQEFAAAATDALNLATASLHGLHMAAMAAEAEAERVKAEREELEKLRAAQAEREAEDRARRAEEDRKLREAQAAEHARQQAELEAQRAEQEKIAAAERAKLAEIRRQQEAEAAAERAKLEAQRRELEAQQAEIRRQQEAEAAARRKANRPTDDQIVEAIASAFGVDGDTARGWLGWKAQAAA